jgi:YHS domain-containing protein
MKHCRALLFALAALASAALAMPAYADQPPVHVGLLSSVAVGGYDPVAYFVSGQPTRGEAQFQATHRGVQYRFANAENLARFRTSPEAYLPQYGGYCAWAVSHGATAGGNPQNWRIVGGRLYLFSSATLQRRWAMDIPNLVRLGDANWPGVLSR